MARINLKSKKTWKKIGTIVLSVALALGSVIGISAIAVKLEEQTHKTISPTFHVGELNDIDGNYVKSSKSIYSDLFECQGLKVTPDFESNVNYRIFYYDLTEKYLDKTETLTEFYKTELPIAKYARIEITPKEDDKIAWYEVFKYSTQLKLEVNKEQHFKYNVLDFSVTDTDKIDSITNVKVSFKEFELGKNPENIYGNIKSFDLGNNTLGFAFIDKNGVVLQEVKIGKDNVSNGIFKVDIPKEAYKCSFSSINSDSLIVSLYF